MISTENKYMDKTLEKYIRQIPKAELHLHIEGSLEPELMFRLAKKNGIKLKYRSVEEVREAYQFGNLQEFLDIYYAGANMLVEEEDFYELTMAYLHRAHEDNIVHTEIFFDPQTHTSRGISFETVLNGIVRALEDGKLKYNITSRLILCFLRHLSEEDAMKILLQALPFQDNIAAVGLDSSEVGNPPSKFANVFRKAKDEGFLLVAHAGEEAGYDYVREALDILHVQRIDHGIQSINDEDLLIYLKNGQIPLTVCPLSNLKLKVVKTLSEHPLKRLLDKGVKVTVNSDDPAYFGGYLNENFLQTAEALQLDKKDIYQLAKNSFEASFISDELRNIYFKQLNEFDKDFAFN